MVRRSGTEMGTAQSIPPLHPNEPNKCRIPKGQGDIGERGREREEGGGRDRRGIGSAYPMHQGGWGKFHIRSGDPRLMDAWWAAAASLTCIYCFDKVPWATTDCDSQIWPKFTVDYQDHGTIASTKSAADEGRPCPLCKLKTKREHSLRCR